MTSNLHNGPRSWENTLARRDFFFNHAPYATNRHLANQAVNRSAHNKVPRVHKVARHPGREHILRRCGNSTEWGALPQSPGPGRTPQTPDARANCPPKAWPERTASVAELTVGRVAYHGAAYEAGR